MPSPVAANATVFETFATALAFENACSNKLSEIMMEEDAAKQISFYKETM